VEVLSLSGDILRGDDDHALTVHGHVVVGRRDGTTAGGHLMEALVNPILIVTLVELQSHELHPHH
jgi:predicted DNA-binding protein with PD1-like motif